MILSKNRTISLDVSFLLVLCNISSFVQIVKLILFKDCSFKSLPFSCVALREYFVDGLDQERVRDLGPPLGSSILSA